MRPVNDAQVLTVAQMQAAEQAVFNSGVSVDELMAVAAGGAAEWVRRLAAGRSVTVLCGPGNNGGDGYVIARLLREFGNQVTVVAPIEPATNAAQNARKAWGAEVLTSGGSSMGGLFVDCLFGSGLSRSLSGEHVLLLRDLAGRHDVCVAIDLPSGVESNTGAVLNDRLPTYDVTFALGAWKYAHWRLPARGLMGTKRLVPIGIDKVDGAAQLVGKPDFSAPAVGSHKYTRGLCAIIGGSMPGASVLAGIAAQGAGAGYVKLLWDGNSGIAPPSIPIWRASLDDVLQDSRIGSVLIGPGLGNTHPAPERLEFALNQGLPIVLDADALRLIKHADHKRDAPCLLTPHDGELEALCQAFSAIAEGRQAKAQAVAKASGMTVLAKGPDTIIADPDGRLALAPPATPWLSTAGSGDVLAGIAASRMATGKEPFDAACEAVWLHGKAASLCGPAFSADDLAMKVSEAYAAGL
ncbi:MAG: NAD(P)H-hydrate dehydratase [Pseudomonadota bacterium]